VRPVSISTVVGGTDTGTRARPEPSVDQVGLEIGSVAAGEVTFSSGSPNVPNTTASKSLLDKIILSWSLDGHGIHTMSAENVTGVQPVYFQVSGGTVFPREEVVVSHTPRVTP